jgi:ribonucleoside-diphosphate reductase beta chain
MRMLFEEQIARKPDLYPWTKQFIEAIWKGFWTPEEFNFRSDYSQFKTDLTEQEQQMVVRTMSAIGQIEIAVKSFWADVGKHLPHPSIKDLGYAMANSEVIHNMAYEKILDVLHMTHVFEENMNEEVIKNRVNYLRKYNNKVYDDDRKQYIYSMKDCAQQVQYTRNEEMLHAQVGIKLIQTLRNEYPEYFDEELQQRVKQECIDSLKAESKVIDWIMGDYAVKGLDANILKSFIAYRMAESVEQIGFDASDIKYDQDLVDETFWFEEELLGANMTDFFQKRPVEYAKGQGITADDLF